MDDLFGARYYDARTSVWQSADPILEKYLPTGDKEQDAKLPGMGGVRNSLNLAMYTYSHQNPVKYVDPDGNLVYGVFDLSTGFLTVVDLDTGEAVTIKAESGGKPYGDPTPAGKYEVLERKGREGFFRLDAVDSKPRNDKHDETGRTDIRLHIPGRTTGCIAACDKGEWDKLNALINKTKKETVEDKRGKSILGKFRDKIMGIERGKEMITKYGEIQVIQSGKSSQPPSCKVDE